MGSSRAIDTIKELNKSQVKIRDPDHVNSLLEKFTSGKRDSLQVVADFDMTLSAFQLKGLKCVSCHKALDDCPKLCDQYRKKAHALRAKYYPIEIDPKMTVEEKLPHIIEWYELSHDLLTELHLDRRDISDIVRNSNIRLRENCHEFLAALGQNEIPLLIFSAGIGDIINETLLQQSRLSDNIHIVSNFMDFNKEGKMIGFKGDMIHVYNKNECTVHESDYFPNLKEKKNIVLLGDSLGDLGMVDNTRKTNVLKIGFLNEKVEQRMEAYMEAYDIVLIQDETMDVPMAIIAKVISQGA